MSPFDAALYFGSPAAVLLALGAYFVLRYFRQKRDTARLVHSMAEGTATPPSLHPIIDANICIGSLSCVKVCPEGDILGLVQGKATLVEASHCIGHSKCALECPVDAIKLVFGTQEKGVDLPETDEQFESSRPGVFIIGELGGMGLIKNAFRQGLQVAESIAKQKVPSPPGGVDVAIIGAGPAGIACAVGCTQAGLSYHVLEQDTVGGTVAHYPRGKVVMSEPVKLPGGDKVGSTLLSKEELLEQFRGVITKHQLRIEEGTKVTGIEGQPGAFSVHTNRGEAKAGRVVLATGLRGSPRKLGVPGEDQSKVIYRLVDPAQFVGQRVLVVGGGDSAVEAAIQLATDTNAKVTLSYRKPALARCKPRNREIFADLVAQNRVRQLLPSQVKEVKADRVILDVGGEEAVLRNDTVIVCIGGELPTKFLESVGVSVRRYHEEEKGAPAKAGEGGAKGAPSKRRRGWAVAAMLSLVGAAILGGLFWVGRDYYWLSEEAREAHRLHELLKPAGLWGHGVGVIATLFMASNFIYAARKRIKALKGVAHIRSWLTLHMFVGIMSPLVIAFHAAFLAKNLLSVATWIALTIVVGTGVFGRFLFGLVPSGEGRMPEKADLERRLQDEYARLQPELDEVTNSLAVHQALTEATRAPTSLSLWQMAFYVQRRKPVALRAAEKARRFFLEEERYQAFCDDVVQLLTLTAQVSLYARIKTLFRVWLGFHVILSLFMVVLIAAHVAVSLFLGYAWIFSSS